MLLRERGADVIAVEPGEAMAGEFHQALPGLPIVRGDGNALPLAESSCDLITYAQSWQWAGPGRSVREALRVLRGAVRWRFGGTPRPSTRRGSGSSTGALRTTAG
jgi:SAM-dependent methyltransferase